MDIIEVLQFNFLDIIRQVIAGLVVLLITGVFTFIRRTVAHNPAGTNDKENMPDPAPSLDVPEDTGGGPVKKPLRLGRAVKFLSLYVIVCVVISIAVFVIANVFTEEDSVVSGSFLTEAFLMLALPVTLIALTVAFIIYTSNVKEIAVIAAIVVIAVFVIELTRGANFDVLISILYSVFHIVFSITIGPCIGIAFKRVSSHVFSQATGIIVGGTISVTIYSLLLLARAYWFL